MPKSDKLGRIRAENTDVVQIAGGQDRIRVRAAWMYYIEGLTQTEIATQLGVSRVAVVRMLADARRRREVRVSIEAPLAEIADIERSLENQFGMSTAVVAPMTTSSGNSSSVIAAAAGHFISKMMRPNITLGVGWGRTLNASLPHIAGRTLEGVKIVSLLGGIAQARRFNPAEFAWQFAELFQGEGFLVPAPAIVDSEETKNALLEKCGIAEIFDMIEQTDAVILSVGGIARHTTSYLFNHISEGERRSLIEAGAVGDILYNFIDADGAIVDHPVNRRAVSVPIKRIRQVPERVLMSGGEEKVAVLKSAIRMLEPTVFITDEKTALMLLA